MAEHLPITLERFAELQARLDEGEPMSKALAAAGLTEEVWRRAQEGWLGLIGDEAERRRFALGQRYQAAYLAARPSLLGEHKKGAAGAGNDEDPLAATTAGVLPDLHLSGALPFARSGVAPPPARPSSAAHRAADVQGDTRDDDPLNATKPGDPAGVRHSGTTLPFKQVPDPSTPGAAPPPAPPPPISVRGAPPPELDDDTNRTITVDGVVDTDAALPFARKNAPAPARIAEALPPVDEDPLNATAQGVILSPMLFKATPFADKPLLPELTLDQYASLCAELQIAPDDKDAIARRYGMKSGVDLDRLEESWSGRLRADGALRRALLDRVQAFAAWLRHHPRR
jgi:hypothetical protein